MIFGFWFHVPLFFYWIFLFFLYLFSATWTLFDCCLLLGLTEVEKLSHDRQWFNVIMSILIVASNFPSSHSKTRHEHEGILESIKQKKATTYEDADDEEEKVDRWSSNGVEVKTVKIELSWMLSEWKKKIIKHQPSVWSVKTRIWNMSIPLDSSPRLLFPSFFSHTRALISPSSKMLSISSEIEGKAKKKKLIIGEVGKEKRREKISNWTDAKVSQDTGEYLMIICHLHWVKRAFSWVWKLRVALIKKISQDLCKKTQPGASNQHLFQCNVSDHQIEAGLMKRSRSSLNCWKLSFFTHILNAHCIAYILTLSEQRRWGKKRHSKRQ